VHPNHFQPDPRPGGTLPASERTDDLKTSLQQRELLIPYQVFATGYAGVEGECMGTTIFKYDTPEPALLDMPARLLLAEEGMSAYYEAPITEA
jgi:hypothetical protein